MLDLESAYDLVPREILMRLLQERLSFNVPDMVTHSLQSTVFEVKMAERNAQGIAMRGVPQGSPISPALFAILIDILAEVVTGLLISDGRHSDLRLNTFADDVILFARNRRELQLMLTECERWTAEYGMTESVQKCVIVEGRRTEGLPLSFCRQTLREASTAEYLGVEINGLRVTDGRAVERFKKAWGHMDLLQSLRSFHRSLPPTQCVALFRSFIRPIY